MRRPVARPAGLAWRPSDRWSFAAQGDIIRYSEVDRRAAAQRRREAADDFSLPDAVEPRFGAEFAAPLWCGCGVVRLRGGLHYRSPGTLLYEGADPGRGARIHRRELANGRDAWARPSSPSTSATRCASTSTRENVFDGPELSFGIVWRF